MAESKGVSSIFETPKELTEEEKRELKNKESEEHNPFKRGPGCKQTHPAHGYSISHKHCHNGAFRLVMDDMGGGVEKYYYYFQKFYTKPQGSTFGYAAKEIYKLKDVFDASVSSSFHGHIGSKVGAVQQQISTYLTQIGQLTKTLLPMVREVRLMDERLQFYKDSFSDKPGNDKARQAEVSLKSTWIEVVEQGMQNPNSVYAMATKLGFVTLPDLFFGINPHGKTVADQKKKLHKYLEDMQKQHAFNQKVRDALTKKLVQYYTWKMKTYNEMQHTWKFRLKAVKQHYNVIRLYTSWLKPYMTTLKALQLKGDTKTADMVSAFETSKMELELLVVIGEKKTKTHTWRSCLIIRFHVVTRPELHYAQGGQRTPTHAGQIEMSIEPYIATKEDVEWYEKYTDRMVMEQVSGVDINFNEDVEAILDSLGDDVKEYLYEAEHGKKKEEKKDESKSPIDLLGPFRGLVDSVDMFIPRINKNTKRNIDKEIAENKKAAESLEFLLGLQSWVCYDVFKKVNGLLSPP